MKKFCSFTIVLSALVVVLASCSEAALKIVDSSKSTFTIVVPDKAASSIEDAALELQRCIEIATRAKLPIGKESEEVTGPIISLGATRQAAAAAVTIQGIPDEGFRILTKNGNLYILGPDTMARIGPAAGDWGWRSDNREYELQPELPGPQLTKGGGFSHGTANGVYTFLEDYLGVRWLMPGEMGRDVPSKSTFEVADIDRKESPRFVYRIMPYLYPGRQKTMAIQQWTFHQKLGFSFRLNHDHFWRNTVPAKLYDKNPEWFAMINGERHRPTGTYDHKLETTNGGLVRFYARRAIEALKANPHQNTYSLSPSDGRGWSQSPKSKALYDPPPAGSTFPSVTPLILKFYRDVADIVAEEYPEGKLSGYIYQDFALPPKKGQARIPTNIYPVITELGFGYRFYRPEVREQQEKVLREWTTKSGNKNWFYYGMPIWLRSSNGMLTTAAPDNLNFLFEQLRENEIKGAYLYGGPSWSQEAMGNYIQAKMLWDPSLDAEKLQHEWLERAYGPAAGAVMEKLYNKMDAGAFADFFRQDPSQHYNVREVMFKEYYAPHYPEIEKLFLEAKAQPMTDIQRKRLELIEQNLIVLQWRLRNAGYLPADFNSSLTRSNEAVVQLITAEYDDFQRFPSVIYTAGINKERSGIPGTNVEISTAPAPSTKSQSIPNSGRILLYASRNEELQLKFSKVQPGSSYLSYRVTVAGDGKDIQSGILYSGKTVEIQARANTAYYLTITPTGISGPKVKWDLSIPGAALAEASFDKDTVRLHGKSAPVRAYISSDFLQEVREDSSGVFLTSPLTAEEMISEKYPNTRMLQSLNDGWRFQPDPGKTGLEQGFAQPKFNDEAWKTVTATDHWQKQGFPDHQGTSWYRKTFESPDVNDDPLGVNQQNILLFFGAVDGDAVVYVNGQKAGEHLLGKKYLGWDDPFVIDITKHVEPGKNLIAVQVTKETLAGGIFKGVSLQLEEK